jgi:hypothetical protein
VANGTVGSEVDREVDSRSYVFQALLAGTNGIEVLKGSLEAVGASMFEALVAGTHGIECCMVPIGCKLKELNALVVGTAENEELCKVG